MLRSHKSSPAVCLYIQPNSEEDNLQDKIYEILYEMVLLSAVLGLTALSVLT